MDDPTPIAHRPMPEVLSVMIADMMYRDPTTRKLFILGSFSAYAAREFPTVIRSLFVHIAVTRIHASVELDVRVVNAAETITLITGKGRLKVPDPRVVAEIEMQLPPLTVAEAGDYRIQIWSGSTLLTTRRLMVLERKAK